MQEAEKLTENRDVTRCVKMLAEADTWVKLAKIQASLGRDAWQTLYAADLGLVETKAERLGRGGPMTRSIRLSLAGWRVYAETRAQS